MIKVLPNQEEIGLAINITSTAPDTPGVYGEISGNLPYCSGNIPVYVGALILEMRVIIVGYEMARFLMRINRNFLIVTQAPFMNEGWGIIGYRLG